MRPISLVVDVANYVMLQTGQPLHTYDAASLTGTVVARQARRGEKLRTLDDSVPCARPGRPGHRRRLRPHRPRRRDGRGGHRGALHDHVGRHRGCRLRRADPGPDLATPQALLRGVAALRARRRPGRRVRGRPPRGSPARRARRGHAAGRGDRRRDRPRPADHEPRRHAPGTHPGHPGRPCAGGGAARRRGRDGHRRRVRHAHRPAAHLAAGPARPVRLRRRGRSARRPREHHPRRPARPARPRPHPVAARPAGGDRTARHGGRGGGAELPVRLRRASSTGSGCPPTTGDVR